MSSISEYKDYKSDLPAEGSLEEFINTGVVLATGTYGSRKKETRTTKLKDLLEKPEDQIQADWETSDDSSKSFIKNKPMIQSQIKVSGDVTLTDSDGWIMLGLKAGGGGGS